MFVSIFTVQRLVEDVKKEKKAVEDKMALAEDELQKTEDLATMLADSKVVRNKTTNAMPCCIVLTMFLVQFQSCPSSTTFC